AALERQLGGDDLALGVALVDAEEQPGEVDGLAVGGDVPELAGAAEDRRRLLLLGGLVLGIAGLGVAGLVGVGRLVAVGLVAVGLVPFRLVAVGRLGRLRGRRLRRGGARLGLVGLRRGP